MKLFNLRESVWFLEITGSLPFPAGLERFGFGISHLGQKIAAVRKSTGPVKLPQL